MSSPLYSMRTSQLQEFVSREIEPDTAYNDSCKAVVHRLCEFMENSFPGELRPSEIIKAGSLGKGTAVKGKSDADIVVFLSTYQTMSSLQQSLPSILEKMKAYLGKYGGCTIQGLTPHAVQISVSCHANHTHEVDILPSVNILKKCDKREIYASMESESRGEKWCYSAALTPLQIAFVSGVPTKVKTIIRLVKFWKKSEFKRTEGKRYPSSYLLELITIGKWKESGAPENFHLHRGLFDVVSALAQYKSLKYRWSDNYNAGNFEIPSNKPYYVVDPANPFNDVMRSCNCWDEVAERAKLFLTRPLFEGLSIPCKWNLIGYNPILTY